MPSCTLLRLGYDILVQIFQLLSVKYDLLLLSWTCRDIREACKPCLFSSARISARRELLSGALFSSPPSDIWAFVRCLNIIGIWENGCDPPRTRITLGDLQTPFVQFLSRMPALETIVTDAWGHNGLPWDGVQAILSCPQLRHLVLRVTPDRGEPVPPNFESPRCSLASFSLPLRDFRYHPRSFVGEVSLANFIVSTLAHSLEQLSMLLDVAPLVTMASLKMPRLRELYLRGEWPTAGADTSVPLLAAISGMPRLRSLTFLRAVSDGNHREMYWRPRVLDRFPCGELERLSIAYPEPTDELYAHLPTTLCSLALRCYPRHYLHQHRHDRRTVEDELGWASPILKSSEMHALLRRCRVPSLEELEIEYEEDASDAMLLGSIAALFPNLRVLTILRYRSPNNDNVPVEDIACALSSLSHLRILRLHLDFPTTPHPSRTSCRGPSTPPTVSQSTRRSSGQSPTRSL
ncbi:hypothetical protein OH77DRAFT_1418494 [Trametes cingulata]|nr:hypothetical protein OH77DRAFT_1418494 [Trametes cingulata]